MQISIAAPLTPLHIASSTAFASFTTFQDVSPSPPLLIPAQAMNAGLDIYLEASGSYSTTPTPTISFGFWWQAAVGGAILAQSSVITTSGTAAAWPWRLRWRGRLRATGTVGSIQGAGFLDLGSSLIAMNNTVPIPITAALRTVTVDAAAARAVGVGASFGTSAAGNIVQTDYLSCLLLS